MNDTIIRGTTPTFQINLDFDSTLIKTFFITFVQNDEVVIEKDLSSADIKHDTIAVKLTQEETLALDDTKSLKVQVRVKLRDETAFANEIENIKVGSILKDGEI